MELTSEELKLIEEYAGLFLSYEEIAALLDKELDQFITAIQNKKSEAYRAYLKGKTISKMLIRKKTIKMASNGSPQAEIMANQYMSDQELSETE